MKRIIWLLIVSVLTAPFFAAAGGSSDPEEESAGGMAEGKVQVGILTWTPIPRTLEKMVEAVNEEHPDIEVSFNSMNYNPQYLSALSAGAASNSLPDIIALQPGSLTQQYRNYLIDLSPYIVGTWGESWSDNFYRINVDQMQLGNPPGDDSLYIVPSESQIINIWYNRALFEQLGISVPNTWDDLRLASKTLSDGGYAPLYFGGADGWQKVNIFLMLSEQIAPGEIYSAQAGETSWTSPGMVKTMEAWEDFFENIVQIGSLSNVAYPDGVGQFVAGRVGMMALGSWWPQEFTAPEAPPNVKNWVFDHFFLPPYQEGGPASPPIGGMDFGFGITTNSENPDAAWRVLESFTAGDGIQAAIDDLNNLPAFKGIAPRAVSIPQVLKDQIGRYNAVLDQARNQRLANPEVEAALQNAMDAIAAGQLSIPEALGQIQSVQDRIGG